MIIYKDPKYNFIEMFNDKNGFLIRSNVIENGVETKETPEMRSFPELLDIGIMGTCHVATAGVCAKAGIDCYQNAIRNKRPNMSLENFEILLNQCKGKTFQVALGGTGDPNKHENFKEILQFTRQCGLIPNLTTSGLNMLDNEIELIKTYCGAVAVSFYTNLNNDLTESCQMTIEAIKRLVDRGCITNIHYILSTDSIDEALYRLKNDLFPTGINAIVFLLYKSVGLGDKNKVLSIDNLAYRELISFVQKNHLKYKVGFDTCQSPAIMELSENIDIASIDMCESARFSMYIDCDMIAYPCSFGHENKAYSMSLIENTIDDVWNSDVFDRFRKSQKIICNGCPTSGCIGCALNLCSTICPTHHLKT